MRTARGSSVGALGLMAAAIGLAACAQPDAVPADHPTIEFAHIFEGGNQANNLIATDVVIDGDDAIIAGSVIGTSPFSTETRPALFFARMTDETLGTAVTFPSALRHQDSLLLVSQIQLSNDGGSLFVGGGFDGPCPLVDDGDVRPYQQGFVANLDPKTFERRWGHAITTTDGPSLLPQTYVSGLAPFAGSAPGVAIIAQFLAGALNIGPGEIPSDGWTAALATYDDAAHAVTSATKLDSEPVGLEPWRTVATPDELAVAGAGKRVFAALLGLDGQLQRTAKKPATEPPLPSDIAVVPGSSDVAIAATTASSRSAGRLTLLRFSSDGSYVTTWEALASSSHQAFTRIAFEPNGRLLALGSFLGELALGGDGGTLTAADTHGGDLFLAEFTADLGSVTWAVDIGAAPPFYPSGIAVTPDNAFAYVVTPFDAALVIDGVMMSSTRQRDSAFIKLRLQ